VCDHHQVLKDGRFHACSSYAQAVELYKTTLVDAAGMPNQLDKYAVQ